MMGDLEWENAVEQAAGGCVVAVLLLALVTVILAALVWDSVAVPIAAPTLIRGALGLAVMAWAEWG